MAAKKKPAARRGGPPTYTPETAERRASGEVKLRLSPEMAARLRQLGAQHPGGVSGLVASWVAAQP